MEYKQIGELVEVYDSLHKTPKTYVESGYPMVRVKDIEKGFLNLQGVAYVDEDVYKEFTKKYLPQKGDIILSRVGSYGIPCFVQTNNLFCLGQNTVILHPTVVNSSYLYYCLSSSIVQNQIEKLVTGSTQKTISLKSIKEIEIPFPEKEVQEKLGDFFFNFDLKLNTNKEIINLCEELSQTLFKRWFIDFEFPNEEGFPYKSSGGKMVDSELGEIPENWEIRELGDILNLKRGYDLPAKERMDGEVPIISSSGVNGYHNKSKVKGPGVVTGRSGQLGNVFYIEEDFWALNTTLYVEKFKVDSPIFSYFLLKTLDLAALNAGSSVPTLNRNHVHKIRVVIPTYKFISFFDEVVQPMFKQINQLRKENDLLVNTRDLLLPKLLSGGIEIPDESVVV